MGAKDAPNAVVFPAAPSPHPHPSRRELGGADTHACAPRRNEIARDNSVSRQPKDRQCAEGKHRRRSTMEKEDEDEEGGASGFP